MAFTEETEMPLKVIETIARKHDGPIGEELVDERFILVEDRAYGKRSRFDQFLQEDQSFLNRLKSNVEIVNPKSLQRMERDGSNVNRDTTCKLGTKQCRTSNRHRVVFFHDDKG